MNLTKFTRRFFLILMMIGVFSGSMVSTNGWANPLSGYNIHVTAPHMMDGEVIGPFHHFCKPINADVIQCILFESDQPNARLTEVEYMVSKKLARSAIPKWSHRANWHDHKQEIETGRVAIINPSDPKQQKRLAEYVAKTDGIIFHLWPKGAPIPDGTVGIAQSVGHWEALHGKTSSEPAAASAPKASSGSTVDLLTAEDFKRMGIAEMYQRR